MGFFDDCETYYGSRDLYEVLHIGKKSSDRDIKKAYKTMSLLVHPDRVGENDKEEATRKFQVLSKIYAVLSDEEKKAVYDDIGEVDEDDESLDDDRDWFKYWRLLFPRITKKDIEKSLAEYKGSQEEREDLKKWYLKFEGDFNPLSEYLIGYEYCEEDRYAQMLKDMIDNKEVPAFKKFTSESSSKKRARQKRYEKEAEEAGEEDMSSLIGAIQERSSQRFNDMISKLENKYAKPPSTKTKGTKRK